MSPNPHPVPTSLALSKILSFMLAQPTLTDQIGTRIFAGKKLPAGYVLNPDTSRPTLTGECILIDSPTGEDHYSNAAARLRVSIMCFAQTDVRALELAEIHLFRAIDDKQGGSVIWSAQSARPSIIQDPLGTSWPVGLAYYDIFVRMD